MLKRGILLAVVILLLSVGVASASEVTMRVDSKHIVGSGLGNSPFDIDDCINVVYVISERQMNGAGYDNYIIQEYPVSIDDYCKVKVGQTVTLDVPSSRTECCRIIKIE